MIDEDKENLTLLMKEKYPHTKTNVAIKDSAKFARGYFPYEVRRRKRSADQRFSESYDWIKW